MDLGLKEMMDGRSADRDEEDVLLRAKRAIVEALATYLWKCPDHGGMRTEKTFLVLPYMATVVEVSPPESRARAQEGSTQHEQDGSVFGDLEDAALGKRARSIMVGDEQASVQGEPLEADPDGGWSGKGK